MYMKRRLRWLWLPLVGGVILAGYYVLARPSRGTAAAKSSKVDSRMSTARAIPVTASAATISDFGVYLAGLGTVTPFNTVTVKSLVDGELMKVAFEEGQLVHEGDLLAEIDPRPFEVQLEQAESQLAKDQAQVGQAEANLERDTAQQKYAQIESERYARLVAQGVIARDQGDLLKSNADSLAGTLTADRAAINSAKAQMAADQAAIHNAKLQLTYCKIGSPITGRIGLRLVDKGNIIHVASPNGLAVITQLEPIAVLFNIAEDHLPEVSKKMHSGTILPVEVWDRDRTTKLATGSLLTIDNQIDQTSGTVRFKAAFPNKDGALFPNQFVNARLLVDTKRNAITVPVAAIQHSPDSTFVYVVKPNNTVEVRKVTASATEGDQTLIESGLSPGELVVTDGVDKLQSGSVVALRKEGGGVSAGPGAGPRRQPTGKNPS
jgi:multidrug efflux system membrane fusion protein